MKKYALLLTVLSSLIWIIPSQAMVPATVYGPEDYEKAGRGPTVRTDTFTISGLSGPGKLIITNHGEKCWQRIRFAQIWLNDELICRSSDFRGFPKLIEKDVNLQETNEIKVKLWGVQGNHLSLEVIKEVNAEAAEVVGSEGGDVSTPSGCSANIPPGALSDDTLINITSLSETPDQIGSIYEFGPPGTSFSQSVTLTFTYDPALLPSNVLEKDLFLASIDDYMKILEDIQIDTINHRVSGRTLSFSPYALGAYYFTGVNISDFSNVATSFRMPIGDDGIEDLGDDLSLLTKGNFNNFNYPKIRFNDNKDDSADNNEWYVATAFNNKRWLNRGWNSEPSPDDLDSTCGAEPDLSSLYNCKKHYHPGEDWNMHNGNDLGKPIHAVADGIVLFSQNQGKRNSIDGTWVSNNFGNIVIIGHKLTNGEIIASVYAHMQDKSSYEPGDAITKGVEIGSIGTSGGVLPHLHFEITQGNSVLLKIEQNGDIKVPAIEKEDLIKGWWWPTDDPVFISNNYHDPSYFIQQHQPTTYTITDISTLGGTQSNAIAINASSQVVGNSFLTDDFEDHAFLLENVMTDLDTLGGSFSIARDINNLRQVVGDSYINDGITFGPHAFLWQNNAMIDLGTLGGSRPIGGTHSIAYGIDSLGQVVGTSIALSGDSHAFLITPEDTNSDSIPDLWFRDNNSDGVNDLMADLGTLGGPNSTANCIVDSGQVVGVSDTASGERHAFLWQNNAMIDLGTLGGIRSSAFDMNFSGQIVGGSTTTTSDSYNAFLITPEDTNSDSIPDLWFRDNNSDGVNDLMTNLGTLGGSYGFASAINASNQVVGNSNISGETTTHAFLWEKGVITDLNDLIPPNSGWELLAARDINDAGEIVGEGIINGEYHGFLMTPQE